MPTYDYVCDACKHEFEEFQSMSAKQLKKCPECGKNKLRRLIGTGAGIIFKGSGFYETDYRSSGYDKDKKSDSEKTSEKSESSEKKTESKTESKAETKSESTSKSDQTKPEKKAKKD